jgi:hypothetical protein
MKDLSFGRKITGMRPVEFGEAVPSGTRLTLFSADKPDRLFTVIAFCVDKVSGVALDLETGVPCYQVEDEEGRIHLLLQLPIGEENENHCRLRQVESFDSRVAANHRGREPSAVLEFTPPATVTTETGV